MTVNKIDGKFLRVAAAHVTSVGVETTVAAVAETLVLPMTDI